jgi:hypothetical protein
MHWVPAWLAPVLRPQQQLLPALQVTLMQCVPLP